MNWLRAMVLGVALTPAFALAQASQPDIANMTDEQITALPDDVLMGLPALEAYGHILGASPRDGLATDPLGQLRAGNETDQSALAAATHTGRSATQNV